MDMGFSDSRALDAVEVARALRPLGWSELCARLVAAQDLRRDQARGALRLAAGSGAPVGSFHRQAALMLATHGPEPERVQDFVNPTSSGSGKDSRSTILDSGEDPLIERKPRQADETYHD